MKIVLIGMAGVGKSYIGKMLSEKLNFSFIDVDDVLFEKTGLDTTALLEKLGDEEFVAFESKTFEEVLHTDNVVFAPGGSIIYSPSFYNNLDKFKIVYLKGNLTEIIQRVKQKPRGIVYSSKMGLEKLFQERHMSYVKYANLQIDGTGSGEKVAQELYDILHKKN